MSPRRFKAIVLAAVLVVVIADPAHATSFHQYARGWESSTGNYKGLSVDHKDAVGQDIDVPNDGCSHYYTGSPIYQTQWLQSSDNPTSEWVEIGTGHQCNNTFLYRFMDYSDNGVFHSLNTFMISGGDFHTFRIVRDDSLGVWEFKVDGDVKNVLTWSRASFPLAATGVESYASSGFITSLHHYNLQYQGSAGTWNDWSGRDLKDAGSSMCAKWSSDTSIEVGQNTTCP
jgi:hypothetical protein